jgi:hypothetical protein
MGATSHSAHSSMKSTYTVKKSFSTFPSPAGMSLTKLSLGGNYDVIYKLFLPMESLVSDIPAGDGNIEKFFYSVYEYFDPSFSPQVYRSLSFLPACQRYLLLVCLLSACTLSKFDFLLSFCLPLLMDFVSACSMSFYSISAKCLPLFLALVCLSHISLSPVCLSPVCLSLFFLPPACLPQTDKHLPQSRFCQFF